MTTYVKMRGPVGCDEANFSGLPLIKRHDDGHFDVPAEAVEGLMHTGGFSYWDEAPLPAAVEPERPVTSDDVLALARKLPVGQERSILVSKIAEAAMTTPRRLVLAKTAPGTQTFVHAGEAFEVRPGGYVITTAEAASAGDLMILGGFEPTAPQS